MDYFISQPRKKASHCTFPAGAVGECARLAQPHGLFIKFSRPAGLFPSRPIYDVLDILVAHSFRLKNDTLRRKAATISGLVYSSISDVAVAGRMNQHLQTEADRARRLAATSYDSKLARELTMYAAELERIIAQERRAQSYNERVDV